MEYNTRAIYYAGFEWIMRCVQLLMQFVKAQLIIEKHIAWVMKHYLPFSFPCHLNQSSYSKS